MAKKQNEYVNCKDCANAEGYENYMTYCKVFEIGRPYGTRKCIKFEPKKGYKPDTLSLSDRKRHK